MGLFFEILSAINDPNKQGSINQLSQITNQLQELSTQYGIDLSTMQNILSTLGKQLHSILNQKLKNINPNQIDNIIGLSFNSFPFNQLDSLVSTESLQPIIQQIGKVSNLDANTLQEIFPTLTSATFNLLNMGKNNINIPGDNSILNTFLDSQQEENFDLGNVFKFANRFLNPTTSIR